MRKFCLIFFFKFLFTQLGWAQTSVTIDVPAFEIYADQLLHGDGDTYGMGTFRIQVTASIDNGQIVLQSQIIFEEGANDFTVILGNTVHRFDIEVLQTCKHCQLTLLQGRGHLNGVNIGARGFKRFDGHHLIQSADIQTDTFGDDVGKIGGKVKLKPFTVLIKCLYATTE
jgi:hypothetical protein